MSVDPAANAAYVVLARGRDEAPALVSGSDVTTWRALRARVGAVALATRNLPAAARVGVLTEAGPAFAAGYLGVLWSGRCAVPLPADATRPEVMAIAERAELTAVIADAEHARLARAAGLDVLEPEGGGAPPPTPVDPNRLAALMFTSGATRAPRGVMISHRNLVANAADIVAFMGLTPADRALIFLPLHYCFGLSLLLTHLSVGASVVCAPFDPPERCLDLLDHHNCTGFGAVPGHFQVLLRRTSLREHPLPSLRWVQQAGGPLAPALIEEVRHAVPAARLYVMYGQTEATARLSYLPPERLDDKLGSIGRGLPSTTLEVQRPDGTRIEPGSDEVGEIVARGPSVALGYWREPTESARHFRDGALRTGDLGTIDAEGFVTITGRAHAMILCLGTRVSPAEVEAVLAACPGVAEAAVAGIPDEVTGEAVAAAVVPEPGVMLAAGEVRAFCASRLAPAKVPRKVLVVPNLPRTTTGKVSQRDVKQLLTS